MPNWSYAHAGTMPTLVLSTGLSLWRWRWMESWTLETLPAHAAFSHICPISRKSTRCFWRVKPQLVQTAAPNTPFQKKLTYSSKVLDSSYQKVQRLLGSHYHLSLLKPTHCTYRQETLKFVALSQKDTLFNICRRWKISFFCSSWAAPGRRTSRPANAAPRRGISMFLLY